MPGQQASLCQPPRLRQTMAARVEQRSHINTDIGSRCLTLLRSFASTVSTPAILSANTPLPLHGKFASHKHQPSCHRSSQSLPSFNDPTGENRVHLSTLSTSPPQSPIPRYKTPSKTRPRQFGSTFCWLPDPTLHSSHLPTLQSRLLPLPSILRRNTTPSTLSREGVILAYILSRHGYQLSSTAGQLQHKPTARSLR